MASAAAVEQRKKLHAAYFVAWPGMHRMVDKIVQIFRDVIMVDVVHNTPLCFIVLMRPLCARACFFVCVRGACACVAPVRACVGSTRSTSYIVSTTTSVPRTNVVLCFLKHLREFFVVVRWLHTWRTGSTTFATRKGRSPRGRAVS